MLLVQLLLRLVDLALGLVLGVLDLLLRALGACSWALSRAVVDLLLCGREALLRLVDGLLRLVVAATCGASSECGGGEDGGDLPVLRAPGAILLDCFLMCPLLFPDYVSAPRRGSRL